MFASVLHHISPSEKQRQRYCKHIFSDAWFSLCPKMYHKHWNIFFCSCRPHIIFPTCKHQKFFELLRSHYMKNSLAKKPSKTKPKTQMNTILCINQSSYFVCCKCFRNCMCLLRIYSCKTVILPINKLEYVVFRLYSGMKQNVLVRNFYWVLFMLFL